MARTSTPAERAQQAKIAAFTSWANTSDPTARTAPARNAFLKRFENQVDPECELPEAERHRRAEAARKAHFSRLALASARSRRNRGAGK